MIKRKRLLLPLLLGFAVAIGIQKVDAFAEPAPLTKDAFYTLCKDLVEGAERLEDLASSAKTGRSCASFSKGAPVTVTLGGMEWNAVYLSTSKNGEILLTLWLSANEAIKSDDKVPWSACGERSPTPDDSFPSNLYSFSYIRSYLCGTPYKIASDTINHESDVQDGTWADFLRDFGEYLVSPENVSYQETESARELFDETYDILNESYGDDQVLQYDYRSKEGYNDWKTDKLFLPSATEIGKEPSSGIWQTSSVIRGTDEENSFWLRSAETKEERPRSYRLDSYYVHGENSLCALVEGSDTRLYVRPAVHLNLSKIAPEETPHLPEKPEGEALHAEKVYDGAPIFLSVEQADLFSVSSITEGATYNLSEDGTGTFSATCAGEYELALLPKNGEWADGTREPAIYTITILKAHIEVPTAENETYNGEEQTVLKENDEYFVSGGSAKDAGDHIAVLTLKDSKNYEFTSGGFEVSLPYKILPYPVRVKIDDASSVYGNPPSAFKYSVLDQLFGSDDLGITLKSDGVNAGNYKIEGSWTNTNYSVTFINGTYTIYKAQVEIPTIGDLVYNGEEQTVCRENNKYFVNGGSAKDAGEYAVELILKDSSNFEFPGEKSEVTVKYNILPFAVTVRIEDACSVFKKPFAKLKYSVSDPLFNGDDLGVLLNFQGINAGKYAIKGTWTNQNYAVTFIEGTYTIYKAKVEIPSVSDLIYNGEEQKINADEEIFTVEGTAKDAGSYEAVLALKDSENYEFSSGESKIKIQYRILPFSVTVEIFDASSVYGKPLAELKYKLLDELFGNDSLGMKLYVEGVDAGKYKIQGTWTNLNYNVTFKGGDYTIFKAQVGIPTIEDLTYNGEEQTVKVDETIFSVEGSAKDTGSYEAILSLKDNKNYEFSSGEEIIIIKYKILPYLVRVKIEDASSMYGEPISKLTYTLLSPVFHQDDLKITLNFVGTNAGSYPIEGTFSNRNYNVIFIGGTYTIYKAKIQIPLVGDLVYNGAKQKIEADEEIFLIDGSAKNVGTHEAVLRLKDATNYEFVSGGETVKVQYRILPYLVRVKIFDASSVYGAPPAALKYATLNEPFGNDDLGISLGFIGENAGSYPIEGTWTNQNYQVEFIKGTYTIHKAKVDLPTIENLVYNGQMQTVKVDGTVFEVLGSAKNAGSYEAVIKLKDPLNYEFITGETENKVSYSILPYAVTVQIESASSAFGEQFSELTYTVLNRLFGDDDLGISLSVVEGKNAGHYEILGTWTNKNYHVTFISGTYTIHKTQVEIPTIEDLYYNGKEQNVKIDEEIFIVEGSGRNAGDYEAVLKLKDPTNYEFVTGEEEIVIKYKILPWAVRVKIEDASSVYGSSLAELKYLLLDDVFGNDDLGIELFFDGENAGSYTIEGAWTNKNYDLTFINGTYTIHKAQVGVPTVENLTYNGEEQKIKVDEEIFFVESTAKDAGRYETVLKLKDPTNYEFATGEEEIIVKYKILPYAVEVKINDASSFYGESLAKLEYTLLSPVFNHDDLKIELVFQGVNAGAYEIQGTWENPNYQVTFINGIYTILKAENGWLNGSDFERWLQDGTFDPQNLPVAKFGQVQIEFFLDENCTQKFEGDLQSAPPGRYFAHFYVPNTENFEGLDEIVPFVVEDQNSENLEENLGSDGKAMLYFALICLACALFFLLAALYFLKKRERDQNKAQDDEKENDEKK